jgi:hypothetical protein
MIITTRKQHVHTDGKSTGEQPGSDPCHIPFNIECDPIPFVVCLARIADHRNNGAFDLGSVGSQSNPSSEASVPWFPQRRLLGGTLHIRNPEAKEMRR